MALPKLETPKYRLVVPSTKQDVEFRPFLVKEEKILMIASESEDVNQYLRALRDIIIACTFNKLKVDTLTTTDLEYIFLQLRCKSIGETVKLAGKCPADCPNSGPNGEKCNHTTEITVDLSEVVVKEPETKPDDMIQLSDTVSVKLKPITVKDMGLMRDSTDFTTTIRYMIDTVYDANEIYDLADNSYDEVTEFVESFPHSALEKIQQFLTNQPKMEHTVEYKCSKCGLENSVTIDGFQNFFV